MGQENSLKDVQYTENVHTGKLLHDTGLHDLYLRNLEWSMPVIQFIIRFTSSQSLGHDPTF